ncbi:hypothetical protein JDV02_007483 [Purpureocillium takamizusanense]|uniref:Uncharacterized protein n=1 Tax=Purpureocillium takamizusanense TaxID=2060973 RepID=A0A9Q8VE65_9HYPO|nr:uncharacterized protein JDV02_007483 [Purpureocillium takamizusanense]UNI21497.1 hypothetical protein JDV02_007483 [Purpureocillium takamizusanense]
MSGSGYNDPEKLAAALELARSFKSGGDTKHRRGNQTGRAAASRRAPQPTQQKSAAHISQPSNICGPPPPSQRQYAGLGRFGEQSANYGESPVLGSSAADFLRRVDDEDPAKSANRLPAIERGPAGKNSGPPLNQMSMPTCRFEEQKPEDALPGSVLDTFFFLVNGGQLPNEEQQHQAEPTEDSTEKSAPVDQSTAAMEDLTMTSPASTVRTAPAKKVTLEKVSANEPGDSPKEVGRPDSSTTARADTKLSPQAASFIPKRTLYSGINSQAHTAVASTAEQNLEWNTQSFANNGMGQNPIPPLSFNIPAPSANPFLPTTVHSCEPQVQAQHVEAAGSPPTRSAKTKGPRNGLQSSKWAA